MKIADLPLPAPIEARDYLDRYDATRINAFQTCPRAFFYEYVLGWRLEMKPIALIFGGAIHEAIDFLLKRHGEGITTEDVAEAFNIFFESYREEVDEERQQREPPNKQPEVAAKLLSLWAQLRRSDPIKVLYTEVPGEVPIDAEHSIRFIIDAIVEHEDYGILNYEHKTTFAASKAWKAQWQTAIQPKIYTHALYCNYPREEVFGTIVNALVTKKEPEIFQIAVAETPEMMADFIWNLRYKVREIEHNFLALTECKEEDEMLQAFPKRETSCTKWNRPCRYLSFCSAWANPLQKCAEVPPGFIKRDSMRVNKPTGVTLGKDGIVSVDQDKAKAKAKAEAEAE